MAKATAVAAALDFTNVKEGGTFNKKRQPEGDYLAKVTKVVDAPSKKDGVAQWLFTIEAGTGTYPYYCKHQENQLWKIRGLLVAASINVPKKRVKVDPNVVVGKMIGISLEDDEYEGKAQSNIASIFPRSELEEDTTIENDDDEDETPAATSDDDDDDDEAPADTSDDEDELESIDLEDV